MTLQPPLFNRRRRDTQAGRSVRGGGNSTVGNSGRRVLVEGARRSHTTSKTSARGLLFCFGTRRVMVPVYPVADCCFLSGKCGQGSKEKSKGRNSMPGGRGYKSRLLVVGISCVVSWECRVRDVRQIRTAGLCLSAAWARRPERVQSINAASNAFRELSRSGVRDLKPLVWEKKTNQTSEGAWKVEAKATGTDGERNYTTGGVDGKEEAVEGG
jgi:hypothetical protein